VLVISHDVFNERSGTVIAVALTMRITRMQPTAVACCGIMRGMRPSRLMRGRYVSNRIVRA